MSEETKKLYRSTTDRWLGGVCAGLGQYFDLDPTVVRVLFLIGFFGMGVGGGVYLLLWILMPEEPTSTPQV